MLGLTIRPLSKHVCADNNGVHVVSRFFRRNGVRRFLPLPLQHKTNVTNHTALERSVCPSRTDPDEPEQRLSRDGLQRGRECTVEHPTGHSKQLCQLEHPSKSKRAAAVDMEKKIGTILL
jgi:hypothetical protein